MSKLEDRQGGGVKIFLPQIADDGTNRHVKFSSKVGEFKATFVLEDGETDEKFTACVMSGAWRRALAKRLPGETVLLLDPRFSTV